MKKKLIAYFCALLLSGTLALFADVIAKVCTKAPNPTDSPGAGTYGTAQTVSLADTNTGSFICYTTDGSAPWFNGTSCGNGTHYTGTFSVGATSNVKYIACATNYSCSTLQSSLYTINLAITLGVHSSHDNGASTATTVVVGPMTPTAGSTIYCDVKFSNSSTFTSVADNVNSGTYQVAVSGLREAAHNFQYASYYKENVSGSATTITLTYATTTTNGQMACKEIKNVPTTYALDSGVLQSQATTATNPVNPNSYTPFSDNEIVLSGAIISTGSVTAGTNYTLLDNTSLLYPEYWIQGTKTATTGAFADSSSADYGIGMAAFAKNSGGFCDSTAIVDWSGGSNTATPTTTTLRNSTFGLQSEPNADKVQNRPGAWTLSAAAANTTYSTSAYRPFVTSRSCPFYSGSGTGTLGLRHTTGGAGGVNFHFDTTQSKVTAGACIRTDTPVANGGTIDTFGIYGGDNTGNPDFVLLQFNSNGALADFELEATGGSITHSSTTWTQNTSYWIRIEFNKAATHKIYIYTTSGASCTGTPTLQETMTAGGSVAGGGPADTVQIFGSSESYAAGTHFDVGAVALDTLYGSSLLP